MTPREAGLAAARGVTGPTWRNVYMQAYNKAYRATETGRQKHREWMRKRHKDRLDQIATIKLARGCADCGYSAHAEALDFDHLGDKVNGIARMVSKHVPMDVILAEIEKCEVVCANCHRVRTAERRALGESRVA